MHLLSCLQQHLAADTDVFFIVPGNKIGAIENLGVTEVSGMCQHPEITQGHTTAVALTAKHHHVVPA